MATIKDKAAQLIELRAKIAQQDEEYERTVGPLKAQRDELQQDVLAHLARTEQLSIRYDFATITRSVRKTVKVVDEPALVAHLKKHGLGEYVQERLNAVSGAELLREAAKLPETLPGTALQETEYISIKMPDDPTKERRNVAK